MCVIFETEHLSVRKFCSTDAKRLYENHLEDEMQKWIPNESYSDLEEAMEAVSFYIDCTNHERLPYVLAVCHRETGELIGDTGLNEVEGRPGEVEIGYSICHGHSGNGYATELLRAMTDFAITNFKVHTLYGRVIRGNQASMRVLEKNSYVFDREEYGAQDDPYGKGMIVYRKDA